VERQDVGGVKRVGFAWSLRTSECFRALSCVFSCRSLRRGKENIRVERQDAGSMIFVGVNVMSVLAGEMVSDALREVCAWNSASLDVGICG
jgi:hypothetical protein